MAEAVAAQVARPPLWRNARALRIFGQVVFLVLVVVAGREAFLNLEFNLDRQQQALSLDFLDTRAGFAISEGIAYDANEKVSNAYLVGIFNTIRVALVGILLASVLGLILGVARLSPNWLVRKIAQLYVDVIRNVPVLVQLIFWYVAVVLSLPAIEGGLSVGDFAFLSVQGAAIPWFHLERGAGLWGLSLLVAVSAAVVAWRWRTAVNERSGAPARRALWALGVFVATAAAGYTVAGGPLSIDVPEAGLRGYDGGLQMSPEFAAVLIGLVVYTAAFIGETIRGAILSVHKGQKEAAEALGLSRTQQLRLVVLPQALRIAIPPINSQYLNLMKNTSLAIAIGFPDVASIGKTIINQKGHETEMLLVLMGTYLGLSLAISLVMNVLNRALAVKGERR